MRDCCKGADEVSAGDTSDVVKALLVANEDCTEAVNMDASHRSVETARGQV